MAEEKQDAIQKVETISRSAVAVGARGVMLNSFAELMAFAKVCADAGLGPKGMSQAHAAIAIQAGLERGMGPLGGLQSAVVINGVLSWRGAAVVGMIQNSGVVVPGTWRSWVENPGTDQAVGYCRALRRGYAEPFIRSFGVPDAKKAGLWKKGGPWESRPDNMLEWRAIGDMGRFHFYDVLGNLPIAEDVEAGGIGPTEARELPAGREPAPTIQVLDPALVELVPDSMVPKDTILFVNRDGTQAGKIAGLAEPLPLPSPEVQAEIDKSVDEAFPKISEAMRAAEAEVIAAIRERVPETTACPRCATKLNPLGGCDCCSWPGAVDTR